MGFFCLWQMQLNSVHTILAGTSPDPSDKFAAAARSSRLVVLFIARANNWNVLHLIQLVCDVDLLEKKVHSPNKLR